MRIAFITRVLRLLCLLGLCLGPCAAEVFADYEPRPPRAPSGLQATAQSATTVDISWSDNSSHEDGFKLYRSRGSGYNMIADLGSNTTSYHDTDLKPGTTYYYKVRAYNEAGESGVSNEDAVTTFQQEPRRPTDLDAKAISTHKIYLNWQDNADNEDGFKVYRDSGYGFSQIANVNKSTNFYGDSDLKPGTKYWYKVTSYNTAGESDYSNTDWAVTFK